MIYLDINTPKDVAATLQENTQIFQPYYIWQITDGDTNITYTFTADDTSPAPWVYNQFTFSVVPGATFGATQGIIPAPQGVYSYKVWATPNQYSLDISTASVVEVGILQINGTVSTVSTFTQSYQNIPTFKGM